MDGKKRVWNKSGLYSVPNSLSVAAQCWSTVARFVVDKTRYFADPSVSRGQGVGSACLLQLWVPITRGTWLYVSCECSDMCSSGLFCSKQR